MAYMSMKKRLFCHVVLVVLLFIVLVIAMLAFYPRIPLFAKFFLFLAFWGGALYSLVRGRWSAFARCLLISTLGSALSFVSQCGCERFSVSHYAPAIVPIYNFHYCVATEKPRVALTFDDGPAGQRTQEILDVLKSDGAHATFFVQGSKVNGQLEIINRMVCEQHEIGNHSWDHPCLSALSNAKLLSQITKTNKAIQSVTGQKSVLLRPPFGSLTWFQGFLCRINHIAAVIYWDSHLDFVKAEKAILREVHPGSIILMHDRMSTAEHVDFVVRTLQKHGYEVVTVSELIENK